MAKSKKALESNILAWKPMKHTCEVLSRWRNKILTDDLTLTDIGKLEEEILFGGKYHILETDAANHTIYNDEGYSKKEAMIDFILAVCPYLSHFLLHRFTEVALAKERNGLDNTFLRNNELARYLLVYETGLHTTNGEIPAVLKAHLEPLITHFDVESSVNMVNHSILAMIPILKSDYQGFETLNVPDPFDHDAATVLQIRASSSPEEDSLEPSCQLSLNQEQPELPVWLLETERPYKLEKIRKSSLLNFFEHLFLERKKKGSSSQVTTEDESDEEYSQPEHTPRD